MNGLEHTDRHPDDTALTAFALGETTDAETGRHAETCPACARQIRELREICGALSSLDDQEVPGDLRGKINRAILKKRWPVIEGISLSMSYLIKNPFVCILGLILLVIFLYVFFVFVV